MSKNAEKRIEQLRAANLRLLRRLEEAHERRSYLIKAVYDAINDGISSLDLSSVRSIVPHDQGQSDEVPIIVFSDWQLGKKTPTYNTEVCAKRIQKYCEKLARIVELHRRAKRISSARVYLLGDIVEGELIFPGQVHHIDASLYRQVTVDGPRILYNALTQMLQIFSDIKVICVTGNHGALGGKQRKEYSPESNADLILYRILSLLFKDCDRIKFELPDKYSKRQWYAIDRIGKYSFLLFHGDQMRGGGFAGIPFYAFARAIYSWSSGAIPEKFDYAICGHWHQAASLPFNFKVLWVNGSTESYNVYAQEEIKAMSAPQQWLLFCHPEHGVTAEYRIWL
ncbi:MAG: hypothetical protein QXS54_11400 [Candidatus Methanomethylicaceae archaeon]